MLNNLRNAAALLGAALVLWSCTMEEDSVVSDNPLLAWVPADTPFLMANLQAVPRDVTDAWLARAQPMLDEMQARMADYREELDSGANRAADEFDRLAGAVLDELDGKLNPEGLASLGIDLESHYAVYGHGLFPVLRLSLSDPVALRAAVARIEADSFDIPEFEFAGQSYWKVEDTDSGLTSYFAILDDHLVMGLAPTSEENDYLPTLLGPDRPARSVQDDGTLVKLVRDKGYAPYGAGYLDTAATVEQLLDADSTTLAYLRQVGDGELAQQLEALEPSCRREFSAMTLVAPRMVAGTMALDAKVVALRYELELASLLADDLKRLVSDVAPASTDSAEMASLSLALEVGRLREFLREKMSLLAAVPFQCPVLADLNRQVRTASENLERPMPPFIGNLKGLRAELDQMDPARMEPERVKGRFAVAMESPQMVIGMASMMIPGFEELNIEPGGDPVALPQDLMMVATPEFEVYAVMTRDAIGMSVGKGQKDRLLPFMEADRDNNGVFLSIEYDARAIMELQRAGQLEAIGAMQDPQEQMEMQRLLDQTGRLSRAYEPLLGRSRMEFRIQDTGLIIDQHQEFP